jgi:hypothetical protein
MSLILIFLIIFFGRVNSSIFGYELLNTDEFVIGAKAMRLTDGFSFTQFDGDTSGVLNAIFLTWPGLFNLDISYISIRLSGILVVSLIIYNTYKIILRCLDRTFSILLIFPLILFFSLTKDPDFLHYTNELISILLIVVSLNYYFNRYKKKNLNLIIASFFLGLVLFAKMQFFPVACLIIFFINFKLLFIEKNFQDCIKSSIAFFSPIIFLSIYHYFNNEFYDLFYNVIHFPLSDFLSRNQIVEKDLIVGSNSIKNIIISDKKKVFINHLLLNSVFHFFYIYFLFFIFYSFKYVKKNLILLKSSFLEFKVLLLISVILITLFVIIITGSVHRHYLINLMPIIPIFLAFFIQNLKGKKKEKIFIEHKSLLFLIFLFSISIIFENKKFYSKNFVHQNYFNNKISFNSPELLSYFKLKKKNDKAIVWGWKPEIYLLSGLTPSNRETTNLKQIDYRPGRDYYRQRFITEFDKANPSLLIDYAKKGAIFYNNKSLGVKSFKRLQNRLDLNYEKINTYNDSCPDYYLRRDKYYDLKKKIIDFSFDQHENKKLKKLKDFNTDESMCDTEVMFSKNTNEKLTLKLTKENFVSEIMILAASKNNKKTILNYEIYNNQILQKKGDLALNKKPFWSVVKFKNKIKADQVIIKLNMLKQNNYGINEIKLF